jgi:hypothetical protein
LNDVVDTRSVFSSMLEVLFGTLLVCTPLVFLLTCNTATDVYFMMTTDICMVGIACSRYELHDMLPFYRVFHSQ